MLVSPHKQKSIFSSNPLLKRNDTSFIEGNEKNEKLLLQFQENSGDNPVYKETTEKKIHSTRTGVVHQVSYLLCMFHRMLSNANNNHWRWRVILGGLCSIFRK